LKSYDSRRTVFQEGERASGFFIVLRGSVKVFKLSPSGEERILHIISEGGTLAEAVLFAGLEKYPAFAQTLGPADLLFVPRRDFLDLMKRDFPLTLSILASLSEKLRFFNTLVEELSLKSADARVAKYILDAAVSSRSDSFELAIRKNELARALGIVPETLSRIFRKFAKKHILRLHKKRVQLLDRVRLERVSSGESL